MSETASLAFRTRNPDVLTCIANLSNDEIFTPPQLANRMLDTLAASWSESHGGAEIWSDPTVTFLDPFAKSGIFLREIVKRLTAGLATEIPDLQERVNHILARQVFGIGITELTSLLVRRSVYCSKWANGEHSIGRDVFETEAGNVWFERRDHDWDGDGKCRYCGANQKDYDRGTDVETYAYAFIHTDNAKALVAELFGDEMQFDVVIGNPPYQLGSSGGEAVGSFAMPIYQKFVEAAKGLEPRYAIMITPSRWFAGGRGLNRFRASMLGDRHLRELVDYPDAAEVFPGIDLAGGVSYFLWDRSHDGPCRVTSITSGVDDPPAERMLDTYPILVRYNTGVAILEKVWPQGIDGPTLARKVSATQPFGLRTSYRGAPSAAGLRSPVTVRSRVGDSYVERDELPRNEEWVDSWKVILGLAYGERGSFPYWITSAPEILGPGTACTETYLVIDRFDSEQEAQLFAAYLRTRFVRFLISLQKYTQHLYNDRFSFVPDLPMDRLWTDRALYEKYGLTEEEIAFIEAMIRPMDPADAE